MLSFRFTWFVAALYLFVSFSAKGQVPDGLVEFIPDECLALLEGDLLPCAVENFCYSLLPTEQEINSIPSASEVQGCNDIETALCPVTNRCPLCKEKADDLFKCVITNSVDVPQNVTDLINGCVLECNIEEADATTSISVSSVPTASPEDTTTATDNPTTEDPTPTDVLPGSTNETLVSSEAPVVSPSDDSETNGTAIPVDSSTDSIMASTVMEIVSGLFYGAAFVLISVEVTF